MILKKFEGGRSKWNHTPDLVDAVTPWSAFVYFCVVNFRVTIAANEFEVAPCKSDGFVGNVCRSQWIDVMDDHAWNITPSAKASLTESTNRCSVCFACPLPRDRVIECSGEFF